MPASPRTISVFGATGLQGGSVVRSLLRDKISSFKVRAITRDTSSEKAQTLHRLGAELVQADGWNQGEVRDAVSGSWAAFVNTNSDDPIFLNPEGPTEFELGKSIIDGICSARVKNVILSTMKPAGEATGGKLAIRTMDMKARIECYAKQTGNFDTICSVHAGWYYEFFLSETMAHLHSGFPYHPDREGYLSLHLPRWGDEKDEGVPFLATADDFGDIVHGMLLDIEASNGKHIQGVSEIFTLPEFVDIYARVTGEKARYVPLPSWERLGEGIPEMEDARLLFAYGELTGGRYFGNEPSSTAEAASLKRLAASAQGKDGGDLQLTTLASFFERHFKNNEEA
ncbi:putative hscarg dehydrogenase [Aspergillus steynii IBT 23096]|uniref:Putative hscarg dehydrogenase n=1 Tax=Aspergillus steynii IBT 23096 TaxID=1392250 RepID=A0A2I2FSI8_9EURO|nr:putative hscarg dehydrogenase [Aspergillus steynii IBT 23096]PLB43605.1 putative hscarg dehydrogenase [Aspergillus steynii IBT 23096]